MPQVSQSIGGILRLWRWLRWAFTGFVSMATPLPWLVDITAARYERLERRVDALEAWLRPTVSADRGLNLTLIRFDIGTVTR